MIYFDFLGYISLKKLSQIKNKIVMECDFIITYECSLKFLVSLYIAVCAAAVPSVAGVLLGGYLMKRLRMTLTGAMKFYITTATIGFFGAMVLMLLPCPPNILPSLEPSETGG